jgi:hypothetical protein
MRRHRDTGQPLCIAMQCSVDNILFQAIKAFMLGSAPAPATLAQMTTSFDDTHTS